MRFPSLPFSKRVLIYWKIFEENSAIICFVNIFNKDFLNKIVPIFRNRDDLMI